MTKKNKIVAVFGSSKTGEGNEYFDFAEQIGKTAAELGLTVANGGYNGTMLASAKGAASAGGHIIGVTCTAFARAGANEYIKENISTDCLEKRLKTLIDIADAYVVLPGSTGTLLELAHVWESKNKGFLPARKPVIIAGNFFKPLIDLIEKIDPGSSNTLEFADTPEKVTQILKQSFK